MVAVGSGFRERIGELEEKARAKMTASARGELTWTRYLRDGRILRTMRSLTDQQGCRCQSRHSHDLQAGAFMSITCVDQLVVSDTPPQNTLWVNSLAIAGVLDRLSLTDAESTTKMTIIMMPFMLSESPSIANYGGAALAAEFKVAS
jgi:hypothetical protein